MDSYYDDGSEDDLNYPCEVKIEGNAIAVSYQEEDRSPTLYQGKEIEGLFRLEAINGNGTATLRLVSENALEGRWREGADTGRWHIELEE